MIVDTAVPQQGKKSSPPHSPSQSSTSVAGSASSMYRSASAQSRFSDPGYYSSASNWRPRPHAQPSEQSTDFPSFMQQLFSADTVDKLRLNPNTRTRRGLQSIEEEDDDDDEMRRYEEMERRRPRAWHERLGSAVERFFDKSLELPEVGWEDLAFGSETASVGGNRGGWGKRGGERRRRQIGTGRGYWSEDFRDNDLDGEGDDEDGYAEEDEDLENGYSGDSDSYDDGLVYGSDIDRDTARSDTHSRTKHRAYLEDHAFDDYEPYDRRREKSPGFLSGTLKFSGDKFASIFGGQRSPHEEIIANPVLVSYSPRNPGPRVPPRSGAGRARARAGPTRQIGPGHGHGRSDAIIPALHGDDAGETPNGVPLRGGDGGSRSRSGSGSDSGNGVMYIQQRRFVELEGFGMGYWAAGPEGMPVWVPAKEGILRRSGDGDGKMPGLSEPGE